MKLSTILIIPFFTSAIIINGQEGISLHFEYNHFFKDHITQEWQAVETNELLAEQNTSINSFGLTSGINLKFRLLKMCSYQSGIRFKYLRYHRNVAYSQFINERYFQTFSRTSNSQRFFNIFSVQVPTIIILNFSEAQLIPAIQLGMNFIIPIFGSHSTKYSSHRGSTNTFTSYTRETKTSDKNVSFKNSVNRSLLLSLNWQLNKSMEIGIKYEHDFSGNSIAKRNLSYERLRDYYYYNYNQSNFSIVYNHLLQ